MFLLQTTYSWESRSSLCRDRKLTKNVFGWSYPSAHMCPNRSSSIEIYSFCCHLSAVPWPFFSCSYRSSEQQSSDASWAPCPQRLPHGRQCWWNDSIHAGSKFHHRHHLSGICVCSFCCHGILSVNSVSLFKCNGDLDILIHYSFFLIYHVMCDRWNAWLQMF